MSDSKRLSQTRTGGSISNLGSRSQEQRVDEAMLKIYRALKNKYPDVTFIHSDTLLKSEIGRKLNELDPEYGQFLSSLKSFVKPDGGFIYGFFPGGRKLLLSMEAKKQGTNDIRMAEGEVRQAKGNAIERSPKNYLELVNLQKNETIFPYLIFISGCDFEKGSTISDRVTAMNCQCDINKLRIHKKKVTLNWGWTLDSLASLFIRKRQWGTDTIFRYGMEAAEIAIAHYQK